ncbi:MAG: hypothetical protein KAT65_17200 [Methanophagales archaeon]|nr:hypothetical protein [Methanophagales archaeon]
MRENPQTTAFQKHLFLHDTSVFDAVKMMREIQDKLSKRDGEDPEAEKRDLQDVRRK